MTAFDAGDAAELFVSNVLNGTKAGKGDIVQEGTVVRILLAIPSNGMPKKVSSTVIASNFAEKTDPVALVIGPTGLGLGENGTLYVADAVESRIAEIPNAMFRLTSAGSGATVSSGGAINGPLGLAIAPNGDILATNGGNGNLVEITPDGEQVATKDIDTSGQGAGTLFGLAVTSNGSRVYFVDNGNNTLNLLENEPD